MTDVRPYAVRISSGFTLIELLVVLVVLSLAMAVVAPRFSAGQPAMAVRSAGQALVAGLQYARNRAITGNRAVLWRLDRGAAVFEIEGKPRDLPGEVTVVVPGEDETAAREPIGIRFYPDGSSSGGNMVVSRGAHRLDIAVDWLTGSIRAARRGRDDA